jgi:hypothetical protein
MDAHEFREMAEKFGHEAIEDAECRGYNAAITSMLEIVRRMKMPETTKAYLSNQLRAIRRPVRNNAPAASRMSAARASLP